MGFQEEFPSTSASQYWEKEMFGAMKVKNGRHLRAIQGVHVSLHVQTHMPIDIFKGYRISTLYRYKSENITYQTVWPTFGPHEYTCDLGIRSSLQGHHWAY